MVDTFRPLELGEAGTASDDGRYAWSWAQNTEGQLDASG
jgi:homogentisate 1,2-dioxygenase